jgi:autotransporter-associated beta strand protein
MTLKYAFSLLIIWGLIRALPAAQAATWQTAADGNWDEAANWDALPVAGSPANLTPNAVSYTVTYRQDDGIAALGTLLVTNAANKTTTLNVSAAGLAVGAIVITNAAINISSGGVMTNSGGASGSGSFTINGGSYSQGGGSFNNVASGGITLNMNSGSFSIGGAGNLRPLINMTGGSVTVAATVSELLQTTAISGGTYTNLGTGDFRGSSYTISGTADVRYDKFSILGNMQTMRVDGGNFTIANDSFVLGVNGLTGTKTLSFIQTAGAVSMAHANGLIIGKATQNGADSLYKYDLSGGTLNLEKITLAAATHTGLGTNAFIMSGGTLNLGSGGIITGGGAGTKYVELSGGTIGAQADWSSTLPMVLNSGTTTFRAAHTDTTAHNITLNGVLSGSGALTKTGTGTLTLSGASAYGGGTTVSNGTLIVNGSITGAVTVATGVLGGTGVLAGSVTNSAQGIITAAATNSIGTLTVTNLVVQENSNYLCNFYDATSNDLINVSGVLTLPNVATVTVSRITGSTAAIPGTVTLFTAPAISNATAGSSWVVYGAYSTSRVKVVGNQVNLVAPSGWVMSVQ